MNLNEKIVLPGGAGLVGINLVIRLKSLGYKNVTVIDKNIHGLNVISKNFPDVHVIHDDLSKDGAWRQALSGADCVVMLQAQISATDEEPFIKNNIHATERVLDAMRAHNVGYLVHISSSVVKSLADDQYVRTKTDQETIVANSGIKHIVLRPTLMYGWFDNKHLGWLSNFMKKSPIFPVPGNGKFMRQPLYVGDFVNIICRCIESKYVSEPRNITGHQKVFYFDILKEIRKTIGVKTWLLKIPYSVFYLLLKTYALIDKNPPFTTEQLKALTTKDEFEVIPWWEEFDVVATPFSEGIKRTFTHPFFSKLVIKG